MEVFQDVEFVRLRSLVHAQHGTYVHATEDRHSVRLSARRASHNAVWAMQRHNPFDNEGPVLLRGAYGRYLGVPDVLCCPLFCDRVAAMQRDFDEPETQDIMWWLCLFGLQLDELQLERLGCENPL